MKNNNIAILENSARRTLHFGVTSMSRWPGTSDSRAHEFMTPSFLTRNSSGSSKHNATCACSNVALSRYQGHVKLSMLRQKNILERLCSLSLLKGTTWKCIFRDYCIFSVEQLPVYFKHCRLDSAFVWIYFLSCILVFYFISFSWQLCASLHLTFCTLQILFIWRASFYRPLLDLAFYFRPGH